MNLGNILNEVGEHGEAIECFRKAIEAKPGFADAYLNLGNILNEVGEHGAAIECFRKAIEAKPGCADSYLNLGTLLIGEGKIEEASNAYCEYSRFKPIAQTISLPQVSVAAQPKFNLNHQTLVPESAEFIPSYLSDKIPFGMHLMYVHIPKSGGIRFGNPIFDCINKLFLEEGSKRYQEFLRGLFPNSQISMIASGRIASSPMRDGITQFFDSSGFDGIDFSFLNPHSVSSFELTLAMEKSFGVSPIRLATWRDPKRRLKSALNYLWRISGGDLCLIREQIQDRDPFLDNAIYRGCFSAFDCDLHGLGELDPRIDCLIDIGDFSVMNQVMTGFLSRCRLPNVIINKRVNVTLDKECMNNTVLQDLTNECIDSEFIVFDSSPEINKLVQLNLPAELSLVYDLSEASLHPLTFVVNATTDVTTKMSYYFVSTEHLNSGKGQDFLHRIFA